MRNLHLTVIVAVFVWTTVVDCKSQRPTVLKKATSSLKPTKGPKTVLDTFKGLPADDFEFIKQLDKQFNKFGDNVKIKIQKVNRTASNKNTKRTIDGSLGYGYQNPNQHDQQMMYTFSKPKYEVYPYSQHDIAPSAEYQQKQHYEHYLRNYPTALVDSDPNYYSKQASHPHTSVEVQQSHSYEIKQTEDGYKTIYHGAGDHQSQEYGGQHESEEQVPVIVLRVPGPAKYATHLQALLQQYLETRAAQYIQTLQEHEAQGLDASQQIHQEEQRLSGYGSLPVLPYSQTQAFVPAQMYIQPLQAIPYYAQPLANPYANPHITHPIDLGDHVVATPSPANYYTAAHSDESSDQHSGVVNPTAYEYHNIHEGQQHHHADHDTHTNDEEIVYGQQHHETVSEHSALTTENFPSDKHTQVYFKSSSEAPAYHSEDEHGYEHEQPQPQQYLQQAHVNTFRAPLVYHKFEHQQYYNPHDDQGQDHSQYTANSGYDDNAQQIVSSTPYETAHTVAITQRPAILPHNYHAHVPQMAHYHDEHNDHGYNYSTEGADENLYKRSSNRKRQSNQNRTERMKKFKNVANRMKTRMTSTTRQTDQQPTQA